VAVDAIKILLIVAFIPSSLLAQTVEEHKLPKKYNIGEVSVDLVGSYYEQDGNHSAVEGGDGSQELTDAVGSIIVNIPIDTSQTISASFSYDTYTSASSSQIDWDDDPAVTSASYDDQRKYGNLSYSRIMKKGDVLSIGVGLSSEWDVFSHSYTLGWQKSTPDNNKVFGLDMELMFDHWDLIYPTDIAAKLVENGTELKYDLRKTLGLTASYSAIMNRKMQAQIVYNFTVQEGLLSTPFHRVYFDTTGTNLELIEGNLIFGNVKRNPFVNKDIERLPSQKFKHAFGLRTSSYPFDWMIIRTFYRYYFDSFGISAHTASIELPIKPTRFLALYPFYRFHIQTASTYFKPFLKHTADEEFYTSDYDLSAFTSHKYGLGIKISPPLGIYTLRGVPFKNRSSSFKSIEVRGGQYFRSDGLNAYFISTDLSFVF
jgi:hypothetical protein